MIGELLNLEALSTINVMIPRATAAESNALFKEISDKALDTTYPKMIGYLEGEKVIKRIHACNSEEELLALRIQLLYPGVWKDLVDLLNAEERLNDSERTFLVAWLATEMLSAANDWYQQSSRQRMQAIVNIPKGKIISLERPTKKGGKIIT